MMECHLSEIELQKAPSFIMLTGSLSLLFLLLVPLKNCNVMRYPVEKPMWQGTEVNFWPTAGQKLRPSAYGDLHVNKHVYGLRKIDPITVKSEDACNSDGHPDHNLV